MKILAATDFACPTGFARVAEHVLTPLHPDMDLTVMGFNYRGAPHPFPFPIWPSNLKSNQDILGHRLLPELVTRVNPDVLFVQLDAWTAYALLAPLADKGVPIVAYIPPDGANQAAAQKLNGLVAHMVVPSEFAKAEMQRCGFEGPISVVPYAADPTIYTPVDRRMARQRMGMPAHVLDAFIVGRCDANQPRKRWDLTLMGFAEWYHGEHPNAYLYCHAPTRRGGWDLAQLASHLGIADRLILTDPKLDAWEGLPESTLPLVYNSFDVFLSTTLGEGGGLGPLEAAACGVPIIAPDYAAVGEWFKDAAWLVRPQSYAYAPGINTKGAVVSPNDVAEALDILYLHSDIRASLAARALQRSQTFSWSRSAADIRAILHATARKEDLVSRTAT